MLCTSCYSSPVWDIICIKENPLNPSLPGTYCKPEESFEYELLALLGIFSDNPSNAVKSVPPSLVSGLYAWYPLDGDLHDLSGNANHGFIPGGVWPATTGPVYTTNRFNTSNEAASFNGIDQFFQTNYTPVCHQDFTLAFWFYSNVPNSNPIMGTQTAPSANPGVNIAIPVGGTIRFYSFWIAGGANTDGIEGITPGTITSTTWTHFAYVHNGTTRQGNLWVNGASVAATANFGGFAGCTSGVGANQWWTGPMMLGYGYAGILFDGRLEDVWFYQGRQLSGANIATLMNVQ